MFRCDHPTGVPLMEPMGPIYHRQYGGYFDRGNPRLETYGTIIDAEFLNCLQEELVNVVIANGDTPDKADYKQLLKVIEDQTIAGPGGGTGGALIPEPANDGFAYSRYRFDPDPGPPATGGWLHALKEPPTSPIGEIAYSRRRNPTEADGEWVVASGRRRDPNAGIATFYVEKYGRNGDMVLNPGDGSQAKPWRTIQYAIDYVGQYIDGGGVGVEIRVGPHDDPISGSSVPWEGFSVLRRIPGCPLDGFRITGQATPDACLLGPSGRGDKAHCCIYVNGGRVNVGGFSFRQLADGTTPYTKGVGILCEGGGSTLTLDGPTRFTVVPNSLDHMWADAGGIIYVKANYTIYGGAAQASRQQNHMHVSNNGLIHFDNAITVSFLVNPQTGGSNQCWCRNFVLGEAGGIARLRATLAIASTPAQPTTGVANMQKWYVCGNAVIDCYPDFVRGSVGAPASPNALTVVPGVQPIGQTAGASNYRWTGGRFIPT
jgi:hypothetical protein